MEGNMPTAARNHGLWRYYTSWSARQRHNSGSARTFLCDACGRTAEIFASRLSPVELMVDLTAPKILKDTNK